MNVTDNLAANVGKQVSFELNGRTKTGTLLPLPTQGNTALVKIDVDGTTYTAHNCQVNSVATGRWIGLGA